MRTFLAEVLGLCFVNLRKSPAPSSSASNLFCGVRLDGTSMTTSAQVNMAAELHWDFVSREFYLRKFLQITPFAALSSLVTI